MHFRIKYVDDSNRNKVSAIKAYRALSGEGLKEAKEFIEMVMEGKKFFRGTVNPGPNILVEQEIQTLKRCGFEVNTASGEKRDNVKKEFKKLIKMSVENDCNDIAKRLLELSEELF